MVFCTIPCRRCTSSFFLRTLTQHNDFLKLRYSALEFRINNLTPDKFTNVWQIERRGIIPINIETVCSHVFKRRFRRRRRMRQKSSQNEAKTMTPTPQYVKDLTHGYSHIATSAFDLLFNKILDHHAPIRSIKVHGKPNPCITEETRELIKSRT